MPRSRFPSALRDFAVPCGLLALAVQAPAHAQQPSFRAGVRTVAIYATVQDTAGALVPDLTRDDFQVFEDGRRVEITQFSSTPQPLSVVVMLDTSQSSGSGVAPMAPLDVRLRTRDAVLAFVDALGPNDRARIGTFGLQIALGAHLTGDRAELQRVLDEEVWSGGGTPLWQALMAAMGSIASEPGRRAVLVFTDGVDTGTLRGFTGGRVNVDAGALRDECLIYAVRFAGIRGLTDDMRHVAESSGGGYFIVPAAADLRTTFLRIAEELRHQYLIGFTPEADDGQVHRVDVRPLRADLRVRARPTFLAGAE